MKLTLLALLLATPATAYAPIGLFDKWGGRMEEHFFEPDGTLTGHRWQFNGAFSSPFTVWKESSFSPWDREGDAPPDYENERGTYLRWDSRGFTGYNFYKTQDGSVRKAELVAQAHEGPEPKYFWGSYVNEDAWGKYTRDGWSNYEINNRTAHTHDLNLEVDWFHTSGMDHMTEDKFYAKGWELGGCFPMPYWVRFGWVEDARTSMTRRP